jgi:tetratricopeptide (TPR) repeat protein
VDEAIRRCEAFRDRVSASPVAVAWMVNPLASLHAMRGDFAQAHACLDAANAVLRELAGWSGFVSHHEALVQLLAGRPERAEQPLRAGLKKLEATDDRGLLATTAAMLAQALYAQGRFGDAGEQCALAEAEAAGDDIVTQVIWRGVRAKLLARDGDREAAVALAREAVALIEPTDLLTHRADALLDLAEVVGNPAYHDIAQAALSLYEQKGNAVGVARARALLGRP